MFLAGAVTIPGLELDSRLGLRRSLKQGQLPAHVSHAEAPALWHSLTGAMRYLSHFSLLGLHSHFLRCSRCSDTP